MKETRTEYLARITAEHPGAYHRIDDLMRSWDAANASPDNAIHEGADVVSAPEPAAPAVEPEEPASASEETPVEE